MRHHFRRCFRGAFLVCMFAVLVPLLSVAQKTVVKDAGGSSKEHVDYDAQGRIVENRTLGPNGKLEVRTSYSHGTGPEVAKRTISTYWPDGTSVQKMALTTFDGSANFLTEVVEDYNQSGKHVSGHQTLHDPMTGIYRCFDWKADPQKYVVIDCPESEESHEGPHEAPTITREEVMRQLAAAREAAQAEEKSRRMRMKAPIQSPSMTMNKEVGLVLPARLLPGRRVSGTVTEDPDRFAGEPELTVVRVTLPLASAGDASRLSGWTFELKDAEPQLADGPISFVVPNDASRVEFTIRQADDPSVAVSGTIPTPKASPEQAPAARGYESPALCFKEGVCTVTGQFSGDSRNTFAAFGSVPANTVAESGSAAYIEVPRLVNQGSVALIVAEGAKVETMMMVVAQLSLDPNHDATRARQYSVTELVVAGVEELSDDQWRYGVYPASNLTKARTLVPEFNPAKTVERDREAREKQEKQDGMKKDDKKEESAGMVLVVVRNATPDVAIMRSSKQQRFEFHLAPDSFAMGEFKHNIAVDGLKDGTYELKATAIPFLAPVKAQEFEAPTSAKSTP